MPDDPVALWRSQPEENTTVTLNHFIERRTRQLGAGTRWEVLMSIAAALFFVAVLSWRLGLPRDPLLLIGYAGVLAWAFVSFYQFRHSLSQPDVSVPSVDFYRRQLERRRDHLRNTWLWHGPLLLACLLAALSLYRKSFGPASLRRAIPLLLLLAAWTVFSFARRRRQAAAIQREIDELAAR